MRYEFRPKQTEDAVARIALAFGRNKDNRLSLEKLFLRLAAMSPPEVAQYAKETRAAQVDLLCEHYHHAPNSACLVAIAELLCHRRDPRWGVVAAHALCQLPPQKQLTRLRDVWAAHAEHLAHDPNLAWLIDWLGQVDPPSPLDHVIAYLRAQRFPFEAREALFFQTPLFDHLADWLFLEGGPLLTWLKRAAAATRAAVYLDRDDQDRLRHYLRFYPQDQVPAELLEQLVKRYGPPDPKGSPFYRPLEEPTLWGLRTTLFRRRMLDSTSPKPQQAYWQKRLHRCQDWRYRDGETRIVMLPLSIIEKLEVTIVALPGGGERRIAHDAAYDEAMDALVARYLGW